jgi:sugar lactone lactonase YvrE
MNRRGFGIGTGLAIALLAGCASVPEASAAQPAEAPPADIPITGSRVHPESVTSDAAGNVYAGSIRGTIYRAASGAGQATAWIVPSEANGLESVFGVLADDRHGKLWVCANPAFGRPPAPTATSALKAFDLASGSFAASYEIPAGLPTACNDIAVAPDGTIFVSETASGRIFVLAPEASELALFAHKEELVGIDGLAFAGDGALYINNVRDHLFQRVERNPDGSYAGLTTLTLDDKLNGPDGLRSLGGNKFLQAEGPGGRVALIEVEGDSAKVTVLKTGLDSSPGVTHVGKVGYATEGKIQYMFDPAFKDKDPDPFIIRAFPLPEGL